MKILFITPLSPFETSSGGAVRTRLIYEALKELGDVHLSIVDEWNAYAKEKESNTDNRVRYVKPIKYNCKKVAFLLAVAFFGRYGRLVDRLVYPKKDRILKDLGWEGGSFDVVVSRFSWIATNVGAWKIAPMYIDIDDLPSEDFDSLIRPTLPKFKGFILGLLIRYWQRLSFRRAVGCWLPNPKWLKYVRRDCRCDHLPNIVKAVPDDYGNGIAPEKSLVTIGSLIYVANSEGIDWFLGNVWDTFHAKYPEYKYRIIGKGLSAELTEKWSRIPGVELAGFVENIDVEYAKAAVIVAPVFIGGGTAVKVIEAVAHGKIVLATEFAARGLSAEQINMAGIRMFSDADSFVREFDAVIGAPDADRAAERMQMKKLIERDFNVNGFNAKIAGLLNE